MQKLFLIAAGLLALCIVVALLLRLTKCVAVFTALLVLVPVLATIMWGEGEEYVSSFASIFSPEVEQQIMDGYRSYHDAYEKNPVIDLEQIEEYVCGAKDGVEEWFWGCLRGDAAKRVEGRWAFEGNP